jgi:hypothetical protein
MLTVLNSALLKQIPLRRVGSVYLSQVYTYLGILFSLYKEENPVILTTWLNTCGINVSQSLRYLTI